MDVLFIHGLRIDTEIGVYEWEKNVKQPISLDIEVNTNVKTPAQSDELTDALDYQKVTDRVTEYINSQHFHLVETVAENVAELLQKEFQVSWVRVRVSKLSAIKTVDSVGVVIERGQG
jgi:dihydroneopterin aldolase